MPKLVHPKSGTLMSKSVCINPCIDATLESYQSTTNSEIQKNSLNNEMGFFDEWPYSFCLVLLIEQQIKFE